MTAAEKAKANFMRGLNCAQSVLLAFSDHIGLDEETALKVSAPFGGGMGRMREVCGTVSGMCMVLGLLTYNAENPTNAEKSALYAREQEVARRFRERNGSIICRELLSGVKADSSPNAEARTPEYYKKRPCGDLCADAAEILEQYLMEEGLIAREAERSRSGGDGQ